MHTLLPQLPISPAFLIRMQIQFLAYRRNLAPNSLQDLMLVDLCCF
jgi:hypothetical protein